MFTFPLLHHVPDSPARTVNSNVKGSQQSLQLIMNNWVTFAVEASADAFNWQMARHVTRVAGSSWENTDDACFWIGEENAPVRVPRDCSKSHIFNQRETLVHLFL